MLSHMHVVFISPLQSVVQVWRASGTAWDAGSHSLWVAAGSWDPAARFCLSIRCSLWCGVFLSGPQSSREQWFPPHGTAATVQFASLHHTLFYSFPQWLQTGSSYLGIPVSRIISDLLPVLGDLSSLLLCPAKHTIHLCETSALSAQPAMLSAIIASLHSRSTCPHVPLHSPEVPWCPCCPWVTLSLPGWAQPVAPWPLQPCVLCVLQGHAPLHVPAHTASINFWPLLSPLASLAEPRAGLYAWV